MELQVFGGYHDNPLHLRRLKSWMEFLRDNKGNPVFIAVEANRILFQAVIRNQRQKFVKIAKVDPWLGRLSNLADLSSAIAYEADTHEEVFDEKQNVIWLDDERTDLATIMDPSDTAERFFACCQKALAASRDRACDLARDILVIKAIDQYIRDSAEKETTSQNRAQILHEVGLPYCDRDKLWLDILKARCVRDSQGYSILVVGENHTLREGNSLVKLLEDVGQSCEVHLLRNEEVPDQ